MVSARATWPPAPGRFSKRDGLCPGRWIRWQLAAKHSRAKQISVDACETVIPTTVCSEASDVVKTEVAEGALAGSGFKDAAS
jgi:hypothetical protein